MPIYAYKCTACGHALDALQKVSDEPLLECPSCGAPALAKQLTAAGFQLKGSGWYATDFKNGSAKPDSKTESKPEAKPEAAASDGAGKEPAAAKSGAEAPSQAKPDTASAKPAASGTGGAS